MGESGRGSGVTFTDCKKAFRLGRLDALDMLSNSNPFPSTDAKLLWQCYNKGYNKNYRGIKEIKQAEQMELNLNHVM
jgi:hypothetical protein